MPMSGLGTVAARSGFSTPTRLIASSPRSATGVSAAAPSIETLSISRSPVKL